ncbi:MAG TPA: phage holin family protein [Cytophagaceae bacterium]
MFFKFFKLEGLGESVKAYVDARIQLFKLEVKEKAANIITVLVFSIALVFTILMALMFLALALGNYLNSLFNNSYMGFAILGLFFLIIVLLLAMNLKKGFLHKKVHNLAAEILNLKKKS